MVRLNGQVMTDIRYQELLQKEAESNLSFKQKANRYFFGQDKISTVDGLLFYGVLGFGAVVSAFCYLIA